MKNNLNKQNCLLGTMHILTCVVLFLLAFIGYAIAENIDLAMNDSSLVDNNEEFDWQWTGEEIADKPDSKQNSDIVKKSDAIDASAYNDLVTENIKLRQRIAEKEHQAKEAKQKVSSISKERDILKTRIKSLATIINDIEKEKNNIENNKAKANALAVELAKAEEIRKSLCDKMAKMEVELKELRIHQQIKMTGSSKGVAEGSDLYERMKEDNAQLKEKLANLEEQYGAVVKERNKIKSKEEKKVSKAEDEVSELKDMLKASKSGDKEQKELIDKLLSKLPAMEKELELLRKKVGGDEATLAARELELASVKEELRLREHRLVKAERMASILDQVRSEVRSVSDQQKRDMHYNMAVVYAKEGKYKQAEEEYLQALRIDPMDAATHYNLAILYDDELNNKNRALIHYRRYLRLRPSASDYDEVRHWIMKLEMQ